MAKIEARLAAMGLTLPPTRRFPKINRRGCVQVGSVLFVSGHGPHHPEMNIIRIGKLGSELNIEQGYEVAKACALTILATLRDEVGDLDRITQVVRLFGMVNCTPEFDQMPAVIDGASDLFFELYGPQAGRHARAAVGMASLPRQQPVEISGEFEVAPT